MKSEFLHFLIFFFILLLKSCSVPKENYSLDFSFNISLYSRVFMLLSCIGQRSLSNSGVLEGLLNLLDNLLCPLEQPQAAALRRTEGIDVITRVKFFHPEKIKHVE